MSRPKKLDEAAMMAQGIEAALKAPEEDVGAAMCLLAVAINHLRSGAVLPANVSTYIARILEQRMHDLHTIPRRGPGAPRKMATPLEYKLGLAVAQEIAKGKSVEAARGDVELRFDQKESAVRNAWTRLCEMPGFVRPPGKRERKSNQ